MSFATIYETTAMNPVVVSARVFASLSELARLNMDTCRCVFSGAVLHWESALQAQTPEQFVRQQADAWPWLAMQIAGYTRGWLDIALEATASLGRIASDRHDEHAQHLGTALDGMARCARGVDAMLKVLKAAPGDVDGAPAAQPQAFAGADADRTSTLPAASKRRSPSPERRQSSR